MFDERMEVPAFEVRVMRQASDIAVVGFFWNDDGIMEVVCGHAPDAPVETVEELLVAARQALHAADWKSVRDLPLGAVEESDKPPF